MMCVSTVNYLVLVNDREVGHITLQWSLKQWCSLSPYMFIIYAHGLITLIDRVTILVIFMGLRFVEVLRVFPIFCSLTIFFVLLIISISK